MMGCHGEEPLQWPHTGFIKEHYPVKSTPLPRTIEASLNRPQVIQPDFQNVMESQIIRHHLSVKRSEAAKLQGTSPETVRQLLNEVF